MWKSRPCPTTLSRRSLSSAGFTLIELLVVISVIAVLIGLALPSLAGSRREARAVPCASNLRAVGQALAIYLGQFRAYPASYVYGSSTAGTDWSLGDQGGTNPNPVNGYVHWSAFLMGDGGLVPEAAFRCPAAPKGGAPATNPGSNAANWDPEFLQTNSLGSSSPTEPPKDRQAGRMAYTANAAIMPRNKFAPGGLRRNQLVRESALTFPGTTIVATELVHKNDWRTVFDGTTSRSHRPISPLLGVTTGDDVYDEPDTGSSPAFEYASRSTIIPWSEIGADMLGYGSNPINAVGRSHPGGGKWVGGTANFVFGDGHGERMSVLDSLDRKLWGDRFYSLTGGNTQVRMGP